METYSSPISVASCWAAVIAASASRESCGALTVEPDAEGSRFAELRQLAAHGRGIGADRGQQRRGDAVALGQQRAEQVGRADIGVAGQAAACTAAEIACCVFVVGLKESIPDVLLLEVLGTACPRPGPTSEKLSVFRSS